MLAKVGVEGSNPFARSRFDHAKGRGKPRLLACFEYCDEIVTEAGTPPWLPLGYRLVQLIGLVE